jgi:hypothetical protein
VLLKTAAGLSRHPGCALSAALMHVATMCCGGCVPGLTTIAARITASGSLDAASSDSSWWEGMPWQQQQKQGKQDRYEMTIVPQVQFNSC